MILLEHNVEIRDFSNDVLKCLPIEGVIINLKKYNRINGLFLSKNSIEEQILGNFL